MTMAQAGSSAPRAQSKAEKVLRAFHEEERYTNVYDLQLAKRLWRYLTPYRALLISSVVIMVCLLYTSDAADEL